MGGCNTIVSAYTLYRHLGLCCTHPSIIAKNDTPDFHLFLSRYLEKQRTNCDNILSPESLTLNINFPTRLKMVASCGRCLCVYSLCAIVQKPSIHTQKCSVLEIHFRGPFLFDLCGSFFCKWYSLNKTET